MFRTLFLSLLALTFLGCCNCQKQEPVETQQEVVVAPPAVVKPEVEAPKVEDKPEVDPESNKRKERREDRRENRSFPRL